MDEIGLEWRWSVARGLELIEYVEEPDADADIDADADEDEDEGPPGIAFCALRECECRYHRPTHPMRVCNGCHLVAYCNAKCQKQ